MTDIPRRLPPTAADLTWAGLRAGIVASAAVSPGAFIYGIAFGAVAAATGLSWLESVLMSLLVFSGTAQMAVVSIWGTLGGALPAMAIVIIANIRYLLMSASLRPWLGDLPARKTYPSLAIMVDSSYAVGMQAYARGDRDVGHLLGPALTSWVGWIVGTGIGHALGRSTTDPKRFGLDMVVVVFCVTAALALARNVRSVWPALAGAVAAAMCEWAGYRVWAVVAAALAAAVIAAAQWRPETHAA